MRYERWGDGLCGCGCGQKTTLWRGRYRLFVAGHHSRGKNNSRFGVRVDGELREKISKARKAQGSPWWIGRHHTAETKDKIAEKALQRPPRPKSGELWECAYCGSEFYVPPYLTKPQVEPRLNRVYCCQRCRELDYRQRFAGEKNPFFGKTHTTEVREKLRASTIRQRSRAPVLPTSIERMVQEELTRRGVEFTPEYPLGKWCVDVFVPSLKLALFVDGCYWHACPVHCPSAKKRTGDAGRIPYLTKCGYRVAVLWEHDIREDVCQAVAKAISS